MSAEGAARTRRQDVGRYAVDEVRGCGRERRLLQPWRAETRGDRAAQREIVGEVVTRGEFAVQCLTEIGIVFVARCEAGLQFVGDLRISFDVAGVGVAIHAGCIERLQAVETLRAALRVARDRQDRARCGARHAVGGIFAGGFGELLAAVFDAGCERDAVPIASGGRRERAEHLDGETASRRRGSAQRVSGWWD